MAEKLSQSIHSIKIRLRMNFTIKNIKIKINKRQIKTIRLINNKRT